MENQNKTKVELSVAQRLNVARKKLQDLMSGPEPKIKKTGNNAFAGFKYFELKDFLPAVNEIFLELDLCAVYSIDQEKQAATLSISDTVEPAQTIVFTCPWLQFVPPANAKMNNVQALGSSITYIHRYLYMMALNIVENDTFDATLGADLNSINARLKQLMASPNASDNDKRKLMNEASARGFSYDPQKKMFK